ncbi:MAG TPA: DUF4232 domain-containing protein [Trebonia sp.]|nr:DUF4232 domain-containing protein [Trebonia sp.]
MRASVRLGWRVAAVAAFAATAALAVTLSRGVTMPAALTSARHVTKQHAATTPRCAASRLHISVRIAASTGASALGVTRYRLEFTNVSGATCALSGYPEVAAYRGDGAQVGNAAVLDTTATARRVLLAPGESAHAAVIASVSPGACRAVVAAGLRVVPPGQSEARYIGHALKACSATGPGAPSFLQVRAVQPGAGITAGPRARAAGRPRARTLRPRAPARSPL